MLWGVKPYSVDLRERVLAALDRGMSRSEVVTTFQVSLASLKRWHAARRDTGAVAFFKHCGFRLRSDLAQSFCS
jgi:transposase